jgi:hypothetical protein
MSVKKALTSALTVAIGYFIANPAMAVEYKYYPFNHYSPVAEAGKTVATRTSRVYSGLYWQWFGSSSGACPSGVDGCSFTYSTSTAIATAWKVGTNVTFSNVIAWNGVNAQLSADFTKTTTDTDTFSFGISYQSGQIVRPASYVARNDSIWAYKGAWHRVNNLAYACWDSKKLTVYACQKFEWKADTEVGTARALTQDTDYQTLTYIVYKNEFPSQYQLEPN